MAVLILRPNGAGFYQAWETFPATGQSHFAYTSDEDEQTGVFTDDIVKKETEALATSASLGPINKVTACMTALATGSGLNETARFIWSNRSQEYYSSAYTVPRSVTTIKDEQVNNPITSTTWQWSDLDDLEIGAQAVVLEAGEKIYVAEFWIEVDYTAGPLIQVADSGEGSEGLGVIISTEDSGSLSSEKVRVYRITPPPPETIEEALGASTRTVEVVRVGSIALRKDYPAKQIVRLRDMAALYDGGPIKELAEARKNVELYKRGRKIGDEYWNQSVPDDTQLAPALTNLSASIEEIYQRLQGKRLSGVDVDIWDQISGAYVGGVNTDEHGTLVLPTDRQFVEALQWKLSGGGYSDCFNGERAAGTPGLFFYFPCNEGKGTTIESFPGVSGQQATLPTGWGWYESGFFNRPAIKRNTSGQPLLLLAADPRGFRSFQFLWYCCDSTEDSAIFGYGSTTGGIFNLSLEGGFLKGALVGINVDPVYGTTEIDSDKWYLIQINTRIVERAEVEAGYKYNLAMNVYLGETLELSVESAGFQPLNELIPLGNVVTFGVEERDGLDEMRHLGRELYTSEIAAYSTSIKLGRVEGKSKGTLGSVGW